MDSNSEFIDKTKKIKISLSDSNRITDEEFNFTNIVVSRPDFNEEVIKGLKHLLMSVSRKYLTIRFGKEDGLKYFKQIWNL